MIKHAHLLTNWVRERFGTDDPRCEYINSCFKQVDAGAWTIPVGEYVSIFRDPKQMGIVHKMRRLNDGEQGYCTIHIGYHRPVATYASEQDWLIGYSLHIVDTTCSNLVEDICRFKATTLGLRYELVDLHSLQANEYGDMLRLSLLTHLGDRVVCDPLRVAEGISGDSTTATTDLQFYPYEDVCTVLTEYLRYNSTAKRIRVVGHHAIDMDFNAGVLRYAKPIDNNHIIESSLDELYRAHGRQMARTKQQRVYDREGYSYVLFAPFGSKTSKDLDQVIVHKIIGLLKLMHINFRVLLPYRRTPSYNLQNVVTVKTPEGLDALTHCIRSHELIIGAEGGICHLAGSIGVPCVAIFDSRHADLSSVTSIHWNSMYGWGGVAPSASQISVCLTRNVDDMVEALAQFVRTGSVVDLDQIFWEYFKRTKILLNSDRLYRLSPQYKSEL